MPSMCPKCPELKFDSRNPFASNQKVLGLNYLYSIHTYIHSMIDKITEGQDKLKKMREQVKEELNHIRRGSILQNIFRGSYQAFRMHSLGKHAKAKFTKEEVLSKSIEMIKKDNPEFEPDYDKKYFQI